MDEQQEFEQVELVWPTAEEVKEGYANLQICWPIWKANLGFMVTSEDDLGLVVSAIDYTHDDFGFAVRLAVIEKIVAPPDFEGHEYEVACGWNQPYLSVNPDGISAPYSFYLPFGNAGVERARELNRYLREKFGGLSRPRMLRSCFGPRGPEYLARMKSAPED
jgi:hypothetical protein